MYFFFLAARVKLRSPFLQNAKEDIHEGTPLQCYTLDVRKFPLEENALIFKLVAHFIYNKPKV